MLMTIKANTSKTDKPLPEAPFFEPPWGKELIRDWRLGSGALEVTLPFEDPDDAGETH